MKRWEEVLSCPGPIKKKHSLCSVGSHLGCVRGEHQEQKNKQQGGAPGSSITVLLYLTAKSWSRRLGASPPWNGQLVSWSFLLLLCMICVSLFFAYLSLFFNTSNIPTHTLSVMAQHLKVANIPSCNNSLPFVKIQLSTSHTHW